MTRLGLLRAPVAFALRRMRARPLSVLALGLALGGAAALVGWSSLTAALSQEWSVRRHLDEQPAEGRSLQVVYFMLPLEADFREPTVADALAAFADVTGPTRRVRISHSIVPGRPRGTRLVVTRDARRDVVVRTGRLPATCAGSVCETLSLGRGVKVGDRLALARSLTAVVVGTGSLAPGLLPDPGELGDRPLLVRTLTKPLGDLVLRHGSTVVSTAPLESQAVHGYALDALTQRLRIELARLERGDPLVRTSAPFALLDDLARRGQVARDRLLLVSSEGAALMVAFAAFLAVARRREAQLADDQLAVLGASRAQIRTARVMEVVTPIVAGAALAFGALWVAASALAARRGLPHAFVRAALPPETVLVIAAVAAVGAALLVVTTAPPRRPRFGVGALELAAVTALAVVAWQTAATGALDPGEVAATGPGPVLLLVPALAFFATGVLLLRLLPLALRAAARLAHHGPFGVRLALLGAARNPEQVAAATTFLAIAIGASLFSLDYRSTLDRQSRDQASFTSGARWRVSERGPNASSDVTPLTRFAAVTRERPTPVLRLDGTVEEPAGNGRLAVQVLALPARSVPELHGWRDGFSPVGRPDLARRLRPAPVKLAGPGLARDARALRVWARGRSDFPRRVVLHVLLRGQGFAHLTLGTTSRRWRLLRLPLGPSLRGGQLVGVEFQPTYVPISFQYEPKGFVELGPIEQERAGRWSAIGSIAGWTASTAPTGTAGMLLSAAFEDAPVRRGIRFDLLGTFQPLIHPSFGLPEPRVGFGTGDVPAVASRTVAAAAVDGLLTLELEGKQIPVRVVGSAKLFPTVVERPEDFVVFDYDTLFATLNADQPGLAVPSEAWFFGPQRRGFGEAVRRPPFREPRVVGVEPLARALAGDPLAAGTRTVLGVAGVVAALLGLVGLVLAARSALDVERLQLAEYEALGAPPSTLRRSAEARLLASSALGILAGLLGAFLSGRLIAAFVAVTATARRPLPPILPVLAWPAIAAVVAAGAVAGVAAAGLLTRRALRDPAGRRLRA